MRTLTPTRKVLAITAAAAVAFTLAACGPSTTEAEGEAEATTDFAGIEPAESVTFWSNHPGGSIDVEKELIAAFTAETGIKVDHVTAGANYEEVFQKFQTAQTAGNAGDLVVLSDATWFPSYLNSSLTPLDDLLEAADVDADGYQDALFGDYLYEGAHYAVPYARSTPMFCAKTSL